MSFPSPIKLSIENVISTKRFLGTSISCTLDRFRASPNRLFRPNAEGEPDDVYGI